MFRDASDALDSLRLGPHTGAGGRAGADSGGSATSSSSGSEDGDGAALHVDPDALSSSPGTCPLQRSVYSHLLTLVYIAFHENRGMVWREPS